MPSRKRERLLRKQRERKMRSQPQPEPIADAHYKCTRCPASFTAPGMLVGGLQILDEEGNVVQNVSAGTWSAGATCPVCGGHAVATNQHVVESHGTSLMGFASTADELASLYRALEELRALEADAPLEDVLDALEAAGPAARPLLEYVKKHHLELAMLGVALASLVLMIVQWLVPDPNGQPTPVPEGVTYDQMERLISEIRDDATTSDPAQQDAKQGQGQGNQGQDDAASHGDRRH